MIERAELIGGKFTIESTLGEAAAIRVCWPILGEGKFYGGGNAQF